MAASVRAVNRTASPTSLRPGSGRLASRNHSTTADTAARVFADPEARRKLESITHPEVFRLYHDEIDRYRDTDRIVVFDAPLIVETGAADGFDVLVVVSTSEDAQVSRLMADRAMSEQEARERIASQLPLEDKVRVADVVIHNDGAIEDLEPQVAALWAELGRRAAG